MEEELFGIKWEMNATHSDKYGPVYLYKHEDFGLIYLTLEAQDVALSQQLEKSFFAILSVLREFYLQNRTVLLCIEDEKKRLEGIFSGKCIHLTFEQIISMFPTNLTEKENRILNNLSVLAPDLGQKITRDLKNYDFFVKNNDELFYMLRVLKKHDFLSFDIIENGRNSMYDDFELTENGWLQIEKTGKRIKSDQAFIAMWFDSTMNDCLSTIEECCLLNKYKPMCIKNKEHNNEISGEILREIENSGFLIADVTGQRQGVYFEAGYAMALRIPVIWTCREDNLKDVHFDTRQYNHVVWKDISELKEKLNNRIKGTIG